MKQLENAALEILGFRRRGEDGMIPALGAVFHMTQLHVGIPGSVPDDLRKCAGRMCCEQEQVTR